LPPHLAAQLFRPVRIALERDDLDAAPGEREGAGAPPRADLDHEVADLEGRLVDQPRGEVRPEEVLTETAPSLVPGRPLGRGHGPSPCNPWTCILSACGPPRHREGFRFKKVGRRATTAAAG